MAGPVFYIHNQDKQGSITVFLPRCAFCCHCIRRQITDCRSWRKIWTFFFRSRHVDSIISFYKKLSYWRGTAICLVSVEILPVATQQSRNYLYGKSWTSRSYTLAGSSGAMCNKRVHSTMTQPSRFHFISFHKQTDNGRVVDITYISTTCCGEP